MDCQRITEAMSLNSWRRVSSVGDITLRDAATGASAIVRRGTLHRPTDGA